MERMNRSSRWIAGFGMLIASLVLTGCQSGTGQAQEGLLGGTADFTAEAIATYYDAQQVRYLTRQEHWLDSSGRTLTIRAEEPDRSVEWVLSGDQFSGPGPGETPAWCDRRAAKMVLTAFLAASGLIDTSSLEAQEPIKIEGQWYQPLALSTTDWAKIRLFKKQSDSRIDRMELVDSKTQERWTALIYNPVWIESFGKTVPTKIDLFRTTNNTDRILVQFHYRAIQYHSGKGR
jgi:hypothetical protein